MEQIEEVLGNEDEDPYLAIDLVELMSRATKKREITLPTMSSSESYDKCIRPDQTSGLQARVDELKVLIVLY